ncbi:MAG: hypothetical protein Q7T21_15495 [Gallionella sp.]|nr:hypothetical protein [Gallionella sp.]
MLKKKMYRRKKPVRLVVDGLPAHKKAVVKKYVVGPYMDVSRKASVGNVKFQRGCSLIYGLLAQAFYPVNAAAEKVTRVHLQIPQKSTLPITFLDGFGVHHVHKKSSVHAGWQGFAGPTRYLTFCKRELMRLDTPAQTRSIP